MKKYQTILFDLDGTLTDPGVGITKSVEYALNRYGITVQDRSTLYPFIGPPLVDSFMKYYGMTAEEADLAVVYYREYFRDRGIFENEVYDGIAAMLARLTAAGKTLILATSKPEEFALRILEHFGLSQYFTSTAAATMDGRISRKGDVVALALTHCSGTDRSRIVMVGDRKHDILGAQQNGLDSVGVLYGYGDRPELEAADATQIVSSVAALEALLLS